MLWIGHSPSQVPYNHLSGRCVYEYWHEKHEGGYCGPALAAAILLTEGALTQAEWLRDGQRHGGGRDCVCG